MFRLVVLLAVLISITSCSEETQDMNISAINVLNPLPNITTAGQPTVNDVSVLKQKGYSTVIDLRGLSEDRGFDEKAVVESQGLIYKPLPISGGIDITVENANKLNELLKESSGDVFVHCASSNRVGALLAIGAFYNDGLSVDDALALGKSAGLTGLEDNVKAIISTGRK